MKTNMMKDTVISRKEDLPATDIDGEVGLMNVETGKYYSLNTIGSVIWKQLEHATTLQELIEYLTSQYDIDEVSCTEEVTRFLNELQHEGIVIIQ